ncbi:MAG: hypothetical protein JO256_11825 [Alphaproteobacteria bacterium]|nr:hypothetical protein [Alphaproteobacteria bacterium]
MSHPSTLLAAGLIALLISCLAMTAGFHSLAAEGVEEAGQRSGCRTVLTSFAGCRVVAWNGNSNMVEA